MESAIVALIAHKAVLKRQIEAAERHAIQRCLDYNLNNVHWCTVDNLILKKAKIT